MTFELLSLLGTAGILFLILLYQGALVPINQGFAWGLGSRDTPQEYTASQGRAARTVANHIEGMAVFAPMIIVAHLAGVSTWMPVWGAGIFLAGRAAFSVFYLAGVPFLRSAAWGVSVFGLLMIAYALVSAAV